MDSLIRKPLETEAEVSSNIILFASLIFSQETRTEHTMIIIVTIKSDNNKSIFAYKLNKNLSFQ